MGQNSSLSGAMLVLRLFIKLVDFVMLFLRKGGGLSEMMMMMMITICF